MTRTQGGATAGGVVEALRPATDAAAPCRPAPSAQELRISAAAVTCIARWGLAKTTLEDVAREAGCSRATVYRVFPGGKRSIVAVAGGHEVERLLADVTGRIDAAPDAVDALAGAIVTAARFMASHEALQTLMRHEPETVLPHLAFDRTGPLLEVTSAWLGPALGRHLPLDVAAEAIEWAARMVLSFAFLPSDRLDLTDEAHARHLVSTYLAPGLPGPTEPPAHPEPNHRSPR